MSSVTSGMVRIPAKYSSEATLEDPRLARQGFNYDAKNLASGPDAFSKEYGWCADPGKPATLRMTLDVAAPIGGLKVRGGLGHSNRAFRGNRFPTRMKVTYEVENQGEYTNVERTYGMSRPTSAPQAGTMLQDHWRLQGKVREIELEVTQSAGPKGPNAHVCISTLWVYGYVHDLIDQIIGDIRKPVLNAIREAARDAKRTGSANRQVGMAISVRVKDETFEIDSSQIANWIKEHAVSTATGVSFRYESSVGGADARQVRRELEPGFADRDVPERLPSEYLLDVELGATGITVTLKSIGTRQTTLFQRTSYKNALSYVRSGVDF